mmetsp:Transcript_32414/g.62594  ORF Transcript_32414/g.62594 Transcript_32414/m.62594 type:complete len:226 (+) Transcript_32414:473-1150(+)
MCRDGVRDGGSRGNHETHGFGPVHGRVEAHRDSPATDGGRVDGRICQIPTLPGIPKAQGRPEPIGVQVDMVHGVGTPHGRESHRNRVCAAPGLLRDARGHLEAVGATPSRAAAPGRGPGPDRVVDGQEWTRRQGEVRGRGPRVPLPPRDAPLHGVYPVHGSGEYGHGPQHTCEGPCRPLTLRRNRQAAQPRAVTTQGRGYGRGVAGRADGLLGGFRCRESCRDGL